jgi:HEAT repeat protein
MKMLFRNYSDNLYIVHEDLLQGRQNATILEIVRLSLLIQGPSVSRRRADKQMTTQLESLIEGLGEPDSITRKSAHDLLLQRGASAIEALLKAFYQGNRYQSYEAACILSQYHDVRCLYAFADALSWSNIMVAQIAAKALMEYGKEKALAALLAGLPDARGLVQTYILEMLKDLGDPRANDLLIKLLQETDSAVLRYSIIETLGVLGASQAVELIRSFQNDENHHVRDRVRAALQLLEHDTRIEHTVLSSAG